MSLFKILAGMCLGLIILIGMGILSYMPPDDPGQILHRSAATQDYSLKSAIHSYEDAPQSYSYSLAFVELDDEGYFIEQTQVEQLLKDLKSKISQADTTILLYVHGWNHNASSSDTNVACFEELLKAAAIMQSAYRSRNSAKPRAVYGIFVGWPGIVYENETLNKALSFFGRQSAADRVGERGALLELLIKIGELRDRQAQRETKFVVVSHSLGARLTYKVLRPIMQRSVFERDKGSGKRPFVADLSIMVNPALTAAEHTALAALLESQAARQTKNVHPTFVIATSEKDEVLDGLFPLSQQVSSFLRGDYALADKRRTKPVGLFDDYVTHFLELEGEFVNVSGANGCPTLRYDELEIVSGKKRVKTPDELYNYSLIKHYDSNGNEKYRTVLTESGNKSSGGIMVVKVSGEIIPNHNDFFTSPFVDFAARVLNAGLYTSR